MSSTDPFERHGIEHLSPSSLRLWRKQPAVWIGKYLLKAEDEMGPGAWRGKAVEAGVDSLLFGHSPEHAAGAMNTQWNNDAQGLIDPDVEKEQKALPEFLAQAQIAFADKPIPLSRQSRIKLTLPGISIPLIGFIDFLWQDCGDDLKTTWKIPSTPDPSHVEQVACYSMHTGVPFSLTYVSPKRWLRYDIIEPIAADAYERVIECAHAVKSFLSRIDNAHDALSMFSPDYTDYHFRPQMTQAIRTAKAVSSIRA